MYTIHTYAYINHCPVSKTDMIQNRVTLIQGICYKGVGKSGRRRKKGGTVT